MIVILFISAVQLFCLGRSALYLHSVHEQTKMRPRYIIDTTYDSIMKDQPILRSIINIFSLKIKLFLIALSAGKISARKLWNVFVCTCPISSKTQYSGASPFVLSWNLEWCNAGCLFCRDAKERSLILFRNTLRSTLSQKGKCPPRWPKTHWPGQGGCAIAVLYTMESLFYKTWLMW